MPIAVRESATGIIRSGRFAKRPGFRGGFSLTEVVVAMSILALAMLPMLQLSGSAARAMQQSQNYYLAVSLAHRVAQSLMTIPFVEIVDCPETAIDEAPPGTTFNPFENYTTGAAGNLTLRAPAFANLQGYLRKHQFRYSLDVVGNQPKDVKVCITWVEQGRNLMYVSQVYVANH